MSLPLSWTRSPGRSVLKYMMSCGLTRLTKSDQGLPSVLSCCPSRASTQMAPPVISWSRR